MKFPYILQLFNLKEIPNVVLVVCRKCIGKDFGDFFSFVVGNLQNVARKPFCRLRWRGLKLDSNNY